MEGVSPEQELQSHFFESSLRAISVEPGVFALPIRRAAG